MRPRATQGKVKKSIFDVLSRVIEERLVIDIFAGGGTLGMEALKRGAREVHFIEKDKKSAAVIRDKLRSFNLGERGHIWSMDAFKVLPVLKKRGFLFELFFADPPYSYRDTSGFLDHFFSSGILAERAMGVVEHSRHLPLSDYPQFKKWKEKRFGETVLTFYEGCED